YCVKVNPILLLSTCSTSKVLERAKSGCGQSLYKDHGEEDIRSVIYRTQNGERISGYNAKGGT
ncbi:MAG: hypothetical protein ACLU6Y_19250, partial [Ruminococcus sp.]